MKDRKAYMRFLAVVFGLTFLIVSATALAFLLIGDEYPDMKNCRSQSEEEYG